MKIEFNYSLQRDLRNWLTGWDVKSYGATWKSRLPKEILSSDNESLNTLKLRHYLKARYLETGLLDKYVVWLRDNVDAKQIEADLIQLTTRDLGVDSIRVYITTFSRAPYNFEEKYFYLTYRENKSAAISAIYHELLHFLFHAHFWDELMKKGLSSNAVHSLKESLTVVLDPVLFKRRLPRDRGYSAHEATRQLIKGMSIAGKKFDEIVRYLAKHPNVWLVDEEINN